MNKMVDSLSSMSSLDITRNPFESAGDDRLNFPGFSPSMFVKQETPASQKKKRTFRWSIEQISRLNPADIDEFPNQEYSSMFERDEEEEEAQKALDEYFSQGSIVPSPWTPNRSIKHVTFSPLPPTTAYISATSSAESSYTSPNSSALQGKADAGCQTRLSLPPQFNLEKLIGAAHYSQENYGDNKELSVSSLRRNLFPFGENSPQKFTTNGLPLPSPRQLKPILKSPHSPSNLITSSPMSSRRVPSQPSSSRSSAPSSLSSPNVSPITKPSSHLLASPMSQTSRRLTMKSPLSPMETSFHNVMESSGIEGVLGEALPDFSPIKDDEMASGATGKNGEQEQAMKLGANSNGHDNHMDESSPAVEMPSYVSACDADNQEDNDKLPELLTMGDLADADDKATEDETTPPEITIEDLSSPFEKDPCKFTDLSEKMDASTASDKGIQAMNSPNNPISSEDKNPDQTDKVTQLQGKPDLPKASDFGSSDVPDKEIKGGAFSSTRFGCGKEAHNPSYVEEIDGDIVMIRARAALRRADRISPPKSGSHALLYSSQPHSTSLFRSSNMDMNLSSLPWQPVGMSTPLVRDIEVPLVSYDSSNFVEKSGVSFKYGRPVELHGDESEEWRGTTGEGRVNQHSPVMEDILRRKQILKSEGNIPFSWTRPSTPPYEGGHHIKSTTPRTYPLSYLERKALYGGMKKELETRSTSQDWHDAGMKHQVKRASWPISRPLTIRMGLGMWPISPPLKVPARTRTLPSGSVSKVTLPHSYYDDNDSGYDSWRKGVYQWQHGLSSHHRRVPTPEKCGFY